MTDANSQVNLLDIPQQLGLALGITPFAAGILASLFVIMIAILAVMLLSRGRNGSASLITGIVAVAGCTAIGWFPVFLLIIIVFMTAVAFGDKMKGVLS